MKLTEEEIVENWNKLIQKIKDTFTGDRLDKILKLHEHFENRMALAPASSIAHYHNAFSGGYVLHVLHVIKFSEQFAKIWEEGNATINFTNEELVFSALFHDLGKIGDLENDLYIPNESEWHRINQGKMYQFNPKIYNMNVTDRTFNHLNYFGIVWSDNEFLGIRLADGPYTDYNRSYLMTFDDGRVLKTSLPYIVHQADMTSTRIEYDFWKKEQEADVPEPKPKRKFEPKKTLANTFIENATDKKKSLDLSFEEFFKNTTIEEKK